MLLRAVTPPGPALQLLLRQSDDELRQLLLPLERLLHRLRLGLPAGPGGSACCYWIRQGTQRHHPAQRQGSKTRLVTALHALTHNNAMIGPHSPPTWETGRGLIVSSALSGPKSDCRLPSNKMAPMTCKRLLNQLEVVLRCLGQLLQPAADQVVRKPLQLVPGTAGETVILLHPPLP